MKRESLLELLTSRLALGGFILGSLIGLADNAFFYWLGVRMKWGGEDAGLLVGVFFTISFAFFCLTIGALIENRRRLRQTQKDLADSQTLATVGRLAAGVAHEVRNPLTVIRSSAMLMVDDDRAREDSRRAAEFMIEEVDRLNRYVGRLLDFSKPMHLSRSTRDLVEVAKTAEHLVDFSASKLAIKWEVVNKPLEASVDTDLLVSAIAGLIHNAVQSIGEAGELSIRVYTRDGRNCIEVADSGSGVPEKVHERLFEPFFTTKSQGTGLGLPMAKRVVQAHGGDIECVPERGAGDEGQGACFRISLPA